MATIVGHLPAPTSSGYSVPETLTGTSGNDTIDHKGGSDQIDGGSGTDTVLFFDTQSHFTITTLSGITHVNALSGAVSPYGGSKVVLTNVEQIQFADGNVALSTTSTNTICGNFPTPTSSGYSVPETLTGTSGNDTIDHKGGSDQIDGGSGTDTVLFFDTQSHFTITTLSGITHVNALSGAVSPYGGGQVTLTSIERLQFADKKIALDLTPEGNAGQAMEFIGAVAPDLLNNASIRGLIISLFDQGQTMESLSQLALDQNLLPTNSNADLANAVYHNVLGGTASAEMTDALVGYIEDHGQANFLATVAGLHINVDLVGLQQTGVEYLI